tara:strand:+ start:502 stop:837 length:336 start_codon:yes stop_codon:yes gene_type:complete
MKYRLAASLLSIAEASFVSKIYTYWFSDFEKKGTTRANYQVVGPRSGRKAVIDETIIYGASDDPIKACNISNVTLGLIQNQMLGGTIASGYNFDCDLKLSQDQAVRVALGK